MTTLIISILIIRLSGNVISGILTALMLSFYTEFMVFSSVFYTPIIMLFLLSSFVFLLYNYYKANSILALMLEIILIVLIYLFSLFFKPVLIFFPIFLGLFSLLYIRKGKTLFSRNLFLTLSMILSLLIFNMGINGEVKGHEIANDFIFFGHTDYGGDGGEGSFITVENKERYDKAWTIYREEHGLKEPTVKDKNRFQLLEIEKFIIQHPVKWVKLQFTKFFRTFGVVPESTSFKILYTGLLKDKLWLTSIIVVAPVALVMVFLISLFSFSSLKELFIFTNRTPFDFKAQMTSRQHDLTNKHFLYIYFLLFFYHIIAIVFFGQYQERYRMPVMVVFIIPILCYFISSFEKKQFLNRISLSIKCVLIVLFMIVWMFQATKAISNKVRFDNAIESVKILNE
jgi:hypothetical protein